MTLSAYLEGTLGFCVVLLFGQASRFRPSTTFFYLAVLLLWWVVSLRNHPYPYSWIKGFLFPLLTTLLLYYVASSP